MFVVYVHWCHIYLSKCTTKKSPLKHLSGLIFFDKLSPNFIWYTKYYSFYTFQRVPYSDLRLLTYFNFWSTSAFYRVSKLLIWVKWSEMSIESEEKKIGIFSRISPVITDIIETQVWHKNNQQILWIKAWPVTTNSTFFCAVSLELWLLFKHCQK